MVQMLLGNHMTVALTRQPLEALSDDRIAQMLADAFPPHRCAVEFHEDGRKVALRVRGPNGAEFVVEGNASIYSVIWTRLPNTFETCGFI